MSARKFGLTELFGAVIALSVVLMTLAAFCGGRKKDHRPPVSIAASPSQRTITPEDIQRSLYLLIKAHPEAVINTDLRRHIERGEIIYVFAQSFDNMDEIGASFTVVTGDQITPPGDPNVQYPVLYIPPQAVLDAGADQTAKEWFNLVVYHEYQHYLQWKSSSEEERVTFAPTIAGRPMTPVQCAAVFRHEHDAYLAQCRLAVRQGWKSQIVELCEGHEEPKRLASGLRGIFRGSFYDRTSPECVSIWDKMAN